MNIISGIRIAPGAGLYTSDMDGDNLLRSLYSVIGCDLIQVIELSNGIHAIFDEEGKLTGGEPNQRATTAAKALGFRFLPGDHLAGSVVFLGLSKGGEHVSLTDEQRNMVRAASQ
uniref:DUF3846 domain-containing protein n=1 Tax=Arthrobacter sp. TaxID=1667 RepID=UPI000EB63098|nr:DUF3846 domain-containing protein [Arthrobacter sp.]AXV46548.1 DUF3846 domain-containing protein [Arthrobacter sp.]